MAITPLHFAFITKYVAHFVAQSLLFPAVAITRFWKNYPSGPFSQVLSRTVIMFYYLSTDKQSQSQSLSQKTLLIKE